MVKLRKDDAVKYTLYNVFLGSLKLLAPFMPHVTEDVYQEHFVKFDGVKSIHLTSWPEPIFVDEDAEKVGEMTKDIIASIRGWKSEKKVPLNAELKSVELIGADAKILADAKTDIGETVKAATIEILEKANLTEDYTAVKPVHAKLGPAFKADAKAIVAEISKMDPKAVAEALAKDGKVIVSVNGNDIELASEYLALEKRLMLDGKAVDTLQIDNVLVAIEM